MEAEEAEQKESEWTRTVYNAALNVKKAEGITPQPRIMIPMVSNLEEMRRLRTLIDREANARIAASDALFWER